MSVIGYTKEEIIGAIAACWNRGSIGSSDAIRHMDCLAELGNKIMAANGAAYAETYNEAADEVVPICGKEIKSMLIRQTFEHKIAGLRVLRGIRYNLIANNGKDFADAEILDGILDLFSAQLDFLLPDAIRFGRI